jgi:hypothetical protein
MNYVGNRLGLWARGLVAMSEGGTIAGEGSIPADQDGLARLVLEHGAEVKACVEMMSGAVWVRDQLRRDLVPALWIPSLDDRALRERLRRRAHLVKARTSVRNRIFGLLTQFGLRISYRRLRKPDAMELLRRRGVPEVWRDSIAEHLAVIAELDGRILPLERELFPLPGRIGAPACSPRSPGSARCSASPSPRRSARWPASRGPASWSAMPASPRG